MRWLGLFLLLVGMAFLVTGIVGAALELGHTYQQALDHPMEDPPAGAGTDDLPMRMLVHVGIGAIGVVPMIVGSIMLKIGIIQRLLRGSSRRPTARRPAPGANPSGLDRGPS